MRFRQLSRYLGVFFVFLFIVSWPLSYVYYRWDDKQVIRVYGGDPATGQRAVAFLGEYLQQHLREGMTREEVHRVIHSYRKSIIYRQSKESEYEIFILDPMETLFVEIGYENGKYKPVPNIDRDSGWDLPLKATFLISGAVFLLISILPFGIPKQGHSAKGEKV